MTSTIDYTSTLDLSGLAPLHPELPHTVVYTKPHCIQCRTVKNILARADLPAISIELDIDDPTNDPALQLFAERLGVNAVPIVLTHNAFTTPVYFAGMSHRVKYLITATKNRLATLHASGDLNNADRYIADLTTRAARTDGSLHPADFIEIADTHMSRKGLQSAPLIHVDELGSEKNSLPAFLH